jgi:hypothetical protein
MISRLRENGISIQENRRKLHDFGIKKTVQMEGGPCGRHLHRLLLDHAEVEQRFFFMHHFRTFKGKLFIIAGLPD